MSNPSVVYIVANKLTLFLFSSKEKAEVYIKEKKEQDHLTAVELLQHYKRIQQLTGNENAKLEKWSNTYSISNGKWDIGIASDANPQQTLDIWNNWDGKSLLPYEFLTSLTDYRRSVSMNYALTDCPLDDPVHPYRF